MMKNDFCFDCLGNETGTIGGFLRFRIFRFFLKSDLGKLVLNPLAWILKIL